MQVIVLKNKRHQQFADFVVAGMSVPSAYRKAGFLGSTQASARAGGCRLLQNVHVSAYIRQVREHAAQEAEYKAVLSVIEKRKFCARIVRTPLMAIDPNDPDHRNGDLILKYKRTVTAEGGHEEFVKLCPLKAIYLDNKLSGDDPDANATQALADAFAQIAENYTTMPNDRM